MNLSFQSIISGIGVIGLLTLAYFARDFHKKFKKTEVQLIACKQVPDFRQALFDVSEYIGYRRKIYFRNECSSTRQFESFYDNNDKCKTDSLKDVTDSLGFQIVKDGYQGTYTGSKYVVEWIERWNFVYDLKKDNLIVVDGHKITFNAPEINILRTIKGDEFKPYLVDQALFSGRSKSLLKMTLETDNYGAQKAREYLIKHKVKIRKEMDKTFKDFLDKLLKNFKHQDYKVEIVHPD